MEENSMSSLFEDHVVEVIGTGIGIHAEFQEHNELTEQQVTDTKSGIKQKSDCCVLL